MPRFLYTQYSFANGELNPRLLGRTDIREYFNSCKDMDRFLIADEGSVNEVSGIHSTYYLGDGSFFGNYSGKIVIDRDPLNRGADYYVLGIKKSGQVAGSQGSNNYLDIFQMYTNGEDPINMSSPSAVRGDTTKEFEYGTHIQLNDTIIVTDKNGNYEPVVFYTTSLVPTSWTVSSFTEWAVAISEDIFSSDEARYRAQFQGDTVANGIDSLTITGSGILANFSFFEDSMVGSHFEVFNAATSFVYRIDAVSNPFEATATAIGGAAANGIYTKFRLPQWYDGNYPKVVGQFDQRLLFANNVDNEGRIWASESGNLANFVLLIDENASDSTPFSFTPFSVDTSPIYWLLTERYLTAGSQTEEFIITRVDGIFSVSNINITSTSKYGSHDIGLAFRAQSASYFVERGGKYIRELSFSEENGGYTSRNIGVLGPELDNIFRVVYDYSRKRIYISSDSGMFSCTIDNSSNVLGWAPLPYTGEVLGVNKANEVVINLDDKAIGNILEYTETPDTKEFFVDDPINGNDFKTVDWANFLGEEKHFSDADEEVGMGSTVTYRMRVPAAHSAEGDILEVVLADNTVEELTVQDGFPVLGGLFVEYIDTPIVYYQKKREFDSVLETAPIQQGSQIGDAQLAFQRVDKLGLRLFKALGNILVGTTETSLEETEYTTEFTGVHEVHVDGCPEIDHTIIVKNTSNRPISLLGISSRGTGQEG